MPGLRDHPRRRAAAPGSDPVPPPCGVWSGTDAATFASDRLGPRPPAHPRRDGSARSFADLFDADAVDELVSRRGLRTPFLRVAKDGTTLADRAFTAGGGVGAGVADQVSDDALVRLFADGATLVLQGLHRIWPPIVDFSQDLAADLGHPVQVNAYVTPPQSRGFSDHYDVHDVFVLQVEGEKRWRIHAPVHPSPLRDQPWTDRRAAVEAAARAEPRARRGAAPRGLPLPAARLPARGDGARRREHPPDDRRPHLDPARPGRASCSPSRSTASARTRRCAGRSRSGSTSRTPPRLAVDLEVVRARLLRAVQEAPVSEVAGRMAGRATAPPSAPRRSGRWPSCGPPPTPATPC